eukprot:TRINITY_DN2690_c0_g1_i1.p1 TRINITY_DN2690_c0_g1~~TRINITY_DN2690_c0_g1_i1.p1  ORF type:complete len:143 (+),score=12.92 TRINITY_DN2690_c0_g1_i1:56-484(+)
MISKLLSLVFRQAVKPLGTHMLLYANNFPRFKIVCVALGRRYHRLTCKLQGQCHHQEASDETAIPLGIELITHLIALAIGLSFVAAEVTRSLRKEAKKQRDTLARIAGIRAELEKLELQATELRGSLRTLPLHQPVGTNPRQ